MPLNFFVYTYGCKSHQLNILISPLKKSRLFQASEALLFFPCEIDVWRKKLKEGKKKKKQRMKEEKEEKKNKRSGRRTGRTRRRKNVS